MNNMGPITCQFCGKKYKLEWTLKRHMKIVHPEPLSNNEEKDTSKGENSYEEIKMVKMNTSCSICFETFTSISDIK